MFSYFMTIYVDIIILENIGMNYIILLATGTILKAKIKPIRLLLSSMVGAIYVLITFFRILEVYSGFFMKIVLSIVMIYMAFTPKSGKVLCKQVLLFYLTSFVFGGCAFALLYFVRPQDILMRNGLYIGTYPIKIAILGAILGFVILTIAFKIVKNKMNKKDYYCNTKLYFEGKQTTIKTMIDTGNMLKDPISQIPVIVVEKEALKELLPNYLLENAENILTGNYLAGEGDSCIRKVRVIPFSSLGKQNGLLLGIKIDKAVIEEEESEVEKRDIIVGIYPKLFTKNGNYQGLIGLELLEDGQMPISKEKIKV